MSEKLGLIPNCIDNLERARDPSSSLSLSPPKIYSGKRCCKKEEGSKGWWTIGRPLYSRVEFNFIENRTSMLRGKNERTFCSTSTSSRRRRTVGGVTSWWIWWDDESLLVGPRGAITVEGDAAWCVSSENIAKNRSWPRLLRRKLKIQRVEGNFRGWKEERGTRRKARRRRRRGVDEEGKDRK